MFMSSIRGSFLLLSLLALGSFGATIVSFHRKNSEPLLGYIYDHKIELKSPLIAKVDNDAAPGERVCNMFLIPKYKSEKPLPFTVQSINQLTGEGILALKKGRVIDYSKQAKYTFQIKAVTCGETSHESDAITVILEVVPPEFPKWTKSEYNTAVPEGLPAGTNILQVTAFELGKVRGNEICKYEISKPVKVPFTIDIHGNIFVTKVLRVEDARHYSLQVTAYDCWDPRPRTSSVDVKVEITKRCSESKIEGLPKSKLYVAGSGVKRFASSFGVEACYKSACPSRLVTAEVSLNSREGGRQQCDLDPMSVESQRMMCNADPNGVALLNDQEQFVREAHGKVNKTVNAYIFDGNRTSFEVPDSVLPISHALGKRFTLSFWLRHGLQKTKRKEQIVCTADGENHNRHHYSVFLHNCKLILLLRKEFGASEAHKFSSAEWRFKLSEVCDSRWHHYALSYEEEKLKLYVDGHIFVPTKDNFEVVDDYPMHNFKDVRFTRMMVGACWRSSRNRAVQHLKGEMAGLILVRNAIESDHVIRCLNLCHEQLDFHAMDQMNPGMSVSLKADLTRIIVNGHNLDEVIKLVQQIGYLNPRTHPIKAPRSIDIDVDIRCLNETGTEISRTTVPRRRMSIEITENMDSIPRIPLRLATESMVPVDADTLKTKGIAIFSSLVVLPLVIQSADGAEKPMGASFLGKAAADAVAKAETDPIFQIDTCTVEAKPKLIKPLERLVWPDKIIRPGGFLDCNFVGRPKTPANVQRATGRCLSLLRGVRYFNSQPDTVTKRTFVLSCPQLSGKYISNEVTVEVDVQQRKEVPVYHHSATGQGLASSHHARSRLVSRHDPTHGYAQQASGVNVGVIVVLVICAGFFVLLATLAVVRLVSNRRRQNIPGGAHRLIDNEVNDKIYRAPTEDEMEWDHTAMTITVNPMEMDTYNAQPCQQCIESEDESSQDMRPESDFSCSEDDDVDLEEYESQATVEVMAPIDETDAKPDKGDLEWDNCSLPPFTHQPPRDPVNV